MKKNIHEIAKLASEWWADAVINPKQDNGDSGLGGLFFMMTLQSNAKPISDETKQRFIQELAQLIEEELHMRSHVMLDVDYSPCHMLSEAATKAELPMTNFPVKTLMSVTDNMVSVRHGYGAKTEYLYSGHEEGAGTE